MNELEAVPGRLDAVVAELLAVPRADVQRAIAAGRVLVDGTARPKSHRLEGGEKITADLAAADLPEAEPGGVPIRHEDDELMIVAKPPGMVTHPTRAHRTGTLVNRLLGLGVALSGVDPERPGIVHRLDAGTSGLLLVAKTDRAHHALTDLLRDHRVLREYAALVRGRVEHDSFSVDAPLGRRGARIRIERGSGVAASTEVEVEERLVSSSLLAVRPRTGRTHQIRVHLASLRHPILGDKAYGGAGGDADRLGLSRPFLHARRLTLRHPVDGSTLDVSEPLPEDLERALGRARSAG